MGSVPSSGDFVSMCLSGVPLKTYSLSSVSDFSHFLGLDNLSKQQVQMLVLFGQSAQEVRKGVPDKELRNSLCKRAVFRLDVSVWEGKQWVWKNCRATSPYGFLGMRNQ